MTRKRVLLISPGNRFYYSFTPSLSLGYVASTTPPEWDVRLVDETRERMDFTKVRTDVVGISVMTPQASRGYEIADIFRKRGIPVVMGGVHVSMRPQEALQYADAVVIGEAEAVWPKVLEDCRAGRLQRIYEADEQPDIDELPTPRRDIYRYFHPFDVIKTTRGCPFNCDFCCIAAFNNARFRQRSVAAVIQELKQINNRYIFFADDNIVGSGRPADDARAMELFQGMIDAGLNKIWMSQASINVINNPELLALMKKSGCRALLLGFEAIEVDALKGRGKVQNLKQKDMAAYYRRVIDTLHDYGIAVNGFFFNGPWDSRESMQAMADFLAGSEIDLVTHTFLTPLPGTRLFRRLENQIRDNNFPWDWDKYDYSRMVIAPRQMSMREFYKERNLMVRKTHSLKRILRLAFKGMLRARSPLVGLFILVTNLGQKRAYAREHARNLREI